MELIFSFMTGVSEYFNYSNSYSLTSASLNIECISTAKAKSLASQTGSVLDSKPINNELRIRRACGVAMS